ncbi:MAG TPA: class I SAM-dependent methyltransferase, partial [Patescibacteria group bacterium]|nr:class I SAM-dependent methyltransferase [Patescibacteria group bacterium]
YQGYAKTDTYMKKKDSKLKRSLGRAKRILSEKPPGRKFLDIGCSVGFMTEAARRAGCEAYGIDIDDQAVGIAKETFKDCKFETIDIADLAKRGDKFDMVYMSEVIEHVPDPDGFMAAVAAVMNKDAVLYLTAPDGAHFGVPRDFASWGMVCPPQHLTYFSRKGLKTMLARHGLTVKKFQFAFKPGMKAFARKD